MPTSDSREPRVAADSSSLRLLVTTPQQLATRANPVNGDERLVLIQTGASRLDRCDAESENSATAAGSSARNGTRERVLLRVSIDQLAQHVAPQWMALGESNHAA